LLSLRVLYARSQVQPVVQTLAQLERDAQLSFFSLQQRFGGSAAATQA